MYRYLRKLVKPLFIIYLLILIAVIILKFPTGMVGQTIRAWKNGEEVVRMKPQLIPFKTMVFYVSQVRAIHDWFFKNLACNLIMFMPFGFLLPQCIKKKSFWKVVLLGCITSVVFEIVQYITALGLCDIDDVILNTVGVAIGYFIYWIVKKVVKR